LPETLRELRVVPRALNARLASLALALLAANTLTSMAQLCNKARLFELGECARNLAHCLLEGVIGSGQIVAGGGEHPHPSLDQAVDRDASARDFRSFGVEPQPTFVRLGALRRRKGSDVRVKNEVHLPGGDLRVRPKPSGQTLASSSIARLLISGTGPDARSACVIPVRFGCDRRHWRLPCNHSSPSFSVTSSRSLRG